MAGTSRGAPAVYYSRAVQEMMVFQQLHETAPSTRPPPIVNWQLSIGGRVDGATMSLPEQSHAETQIVN